MKTTSGQEALASYHALSFVMGHVGINLKTHWIREVHIEDLGENRARVVVVISEYNKEGATVLPEIIMSEIRNYELATVSYEGKQYWRDFGFPNPWTEIVEPEWDDEPLTANPA